MDTTRIEELQSKLAAADAADAPDVADDLTAALAEALDEEGAAAPDAGAEPAPGQERKPLQDGGAL